MNNEIVNPTADSPKLSASQQAVYRRDGYLVAKGIFTIDECAEMRLEADRLAAWKEITSPNNLRTEMRELSRGRYETNKFDPVVDVSSVFQGVVEDGRIQGLLSSFLDGRPLLFKDKLIFKNAGHDGFGPHQDHTWYRQFSDELIAATVSIDAADEENGALEVAAGCHVMGNPVPDGEVRDLSTTECPADETWRMLNTDIGDVVLFDALLPHRSGRNASRHPRRSLYLTFNSSRHGDLYASYYRYRRTLMRQDNGRSRGNFYTPREFRDAADYYPPIPKLNGPY
jgi:ectoine hydroxylase-related dioxygenase (phytanoyl-CoA dioxygenase family)